jgi:hypothetical protein
VSRGEDGRNLVGERRDVENRKGKKEAMDDVRAGDARCASIGVEC